MKIIYNNDLEKYENFKHLIDYKNIKNTLPNVNVSKGLLFINTMLTTTVTQPVYR